MQRFELLGRNGAGANSTVFKCRDTSSGAVVAVKKLEGAGLQHVIREAAIMRACAHKNCVELLEAYQGTASGTMYLVMENVEHSLARELLLTPRGLPLIRAKFIAFQLAQALEQAHSKQVCHGDIKPANILLTSKCSVKLCDFGSSSSTVLDRCHDAGGVGAPAAGLLPLQPCGADGVLSALKPVTAAASRWYCAPESLLGSEGSPASDIWALGCILAELVTGKPLMPGSEEELNQLCCVVSMIGHLSTSQEQLIELLPWCQRSKIQEARSRGPLLERIPKLAASPDLTQVLRACLHPDPAQRPTAQQLQAMSFFQDVRQALQDSEAAAAAQAPAAAVFPAPPVSTARTPSRVPSFPRSSSSGSMEMDSCLAADSSPKSMSPCTAGSPTLAAPSGAPGTTATASASSEAAATTLAAPPASAKGVRRVGGVQPAAPVRPAPRARVSALTATIRGKPFDDDGGYTDLMPLVLRLVARWNATPELDAALGPIALAARGGSSVSLQVSLSSTLSGELRALGNTMWTASGCPVPTATAAPEPPAVVGAAAAVTTVAVVTACATPIAAAAGGCGAAGGQARVAATATPASAAKAPGGGASPMDTTPAAPATVPGAAAAAVFAGAVPCAVPGDSSSKPGIPISASVGAVPYLAKAAGLAPCPASAAIRLTPAQLRSRAIINRARRHHCRPDSLPNAFLVSSSCPRSGGGTGLGSSATLLQHELAAAAAPPSCRGGQPTNRMGPLGALGGRQFSHAGRRSFADLSDLASVAECAPLDCQGAWPQDVKRRRGLGLVTGLGLGLGPHHGPSAGLRSASISVASFGSLMTELSLGSLPENEPLLVSGGRAAGVSGGRRMRRSSSGAALATASPVRAGGWQPWMPGGLGGAAGAGRTVSQPQPICGRNRSAGLGPARPGLGLVDSVSSDMQNSAASDVLLREELA